MWVLELFLPSGILRCSLVGGIHYTIGRKDCDIVAPDADVSMSRCHATIFVSSTPAQYLSDLQYVPDIEIQDQSKHGILVNGQKISAHEDRIKLFPNDIVTLGRKIEMRLCYTPIVVSVSSQLTRQQQDEIIAATCRIGGIFTEDPLSPIEFHEAQKSPFLFAFCTNEVSGEPRALLAMMCHYVLVSTSYIQDLFTVVRDGVTLPFYALPQPGNFDALRSPVLADMPYHRPEPALYEIRDFLLRPPPTFDFIFRTMHFVFLDQSSFIRYEPVINFGGGTLSFVPPEKVLEWQLETVDAFGDSNALPFRGLVEDKYAHGHNMYVIVPSSVFQTVSETATNGSYFKLAGKKVLNPTIEAYLKLWGIDRMLLHEENIHVSIYCNDTAAQLQPAAPGVLFKTEMILAKDDSDDDTDATVEPTDRSEQFASKANQDIVPHPAMQIIAISQQPKEESSPVQTKGFELYEKWQQFRAVPEASSTIGQSPTRSGLSKNIGAPSALNLFSDEIAYPLSSRLFVAPNIRGGAGPADKVEAHCASFINTSLLVFCPKVEEVCRGSLKLRYLDGGNKAFLESVLKRIANFLATLRKLLMQVEEISLPYVAKRRLDFVRDRCELTTNAIMATGDFLKVKFVIAARPSRKGKPGASPTREGDVLPL